MSGCFVVFKCKLDTQLSYNFCAKHQQEWSGPVQYRWLGSCTTLTIFWIKKQVTNIFKRMMILIKTESQCNVSSTNMEIWTREQVMLGNIIICLTKDNNHTSNLKLFGKTDNNILIFFSCKLTSFNLCKPIWGESLMVIPSKNSLCPPHSSKWQCLRPFRASHDTIHPIPLVQFYPQILKSHNTTKASVMPLYLLKSHIHLFCPFFPERAVWRQGGCQGNKIEAYEISTLF